MKRDYNFHHTCYRYTHGNPPSKDEVHPCFFCGEKLPLTTIECKTCGIMVCTNCHNCLCTIDDDAYNTIVKVHKQICCHLDKYDGTDPDCPDLLTLMFCMDAVDNCYRIQFGKDPS